MKKKAKRSFVYFITSDKFLQALVTGAVFAVINKTTLNVAIGLNAVLGFFGFPTVPVPSVGVVLMAGVVAFAFWADNHTEDWREWVEDVTGEDSADDG